MIPGVSVRATSPCRRAIRRVTRSVYSSSSLVPEMTCSTTPTAAITSDISSASAKPSIRSQSGKISSTTSSSAASASRIRMKPIASMNGSRSAASTGGTIAFRIASDSATTQPGARPLERDARDESGGHVHRDRQDGQ